MNAGKCKIMESNNWEDSTVITDEGTNVEVVEDFCYLGSYFTRTGNCDKECMIRTARQATQCELRGYKRKPGRPRKNWVNVIKQDLKNMDLTWEEAQVQANDKSRMVSTYGPTQHLDAG